MLYALCCLGSANFFVDDTQSWMCLLTNGLNSGYNMARMKYEILFAQEAVQDFKRLSARDRSIVKEAIGKHLRHEPQRISKSRIKKLRGMSRPQYRLRVGEIRVFYDIVEQRVEVLAIVPKSKAATWLEELREEK
jgi:mRNA-degrading endonuclease RelE of RelBE toxin-antitoxin system